MTKTKIEWTDEVWNPVSGCNKVSQGCKHCYAERVFPRPYPGRAFTDVRTHADRLAAPLRWRKPRRVFVNSMSDLFHDDVPDEFIDEVFAVMALSPQHSFQVLTKRPERMRNYLTRQCGEGRQEIRNQLVFVAVPKIMNQWYPRWKEEGTDGPHRGRAIKSFSQWPLPNVWLGVSVEDQETADYRIPLLLQTPAAVRWVSAEPLLGPICFEGMFANSNPADGTNALEEINWLVAGGESGPQARPMHPDWARSLRDQCAAAGVPFFFKQWGEWAPNVGAVDGWAIDDDPEISRFDHREWEDGEWSETFRPMWCDFADGNYDEEQCVSRLGKKTAGRLLDGREHLEYPNAHD